MLFAETNKEKFGFLNSSAYVVSASAAVACAYDTKQCLSRLQRGQVGAGA
jgi:hypothetical protein